MTNDFNWMTFKARELVIDRNTPPPKEQWTEAIGGFDQNLQSSPFWRGDLYLQGVDWYGENFASSVFDPLKSNVKTWQNNASICKRVPPSSRRGELSYSHHAEVAYLKPEDFAEKHPDLGLMDPETLQDYYLDLAIENLLSVTQLRAKLKFDKGEEEADPLGDPIAFQKGSVPTRIEKTRDRVQRIIDDADNIMVIDHLNAAYNALQLAFEATQKKKESEPEPIPEATELFDAVAETFTA